MATRIFSILSKYDQQAMGQNRNPILWTPSQEASTQTPARPHQIRARPTTAGHDQFSTIQNPRSNAEKNALAVTKRTKTKLSSSTVRPTQNAHLPWLNSRKISSVPRFTPIRYNTGHMDSQNAGKDIKPRQLMAQSSPCRVPLPASPPLDRLSETPTALKRKDETETTVAAPPKPAQSTNYQQQSMS